jgi:hypothetical protein
MSNERLTARDARALLAAALLLGLAADVVMPEPPWRSGLTIWILFALPLALACTRAATLRNGVVFGRDQVILVAAILLGALGFVFRDAEALYALRFLGTLLAAALLAWRASKATNSLGTLRVVDLFLVPAQAGVSAAVGAPALALLEGRGRATPGAPGAAGTDAQGNRPLAVAGIVLAVPVALIVGALLVSSDPVFGALLTRWFDLPFERAIEHLARIGFFAWIAAGWLRSFVKPVEAPGVVDELERVRPAAAFPLVAPTMYTTILLLVAFLLVQARTLFGGASYVELTSGVTYAQYARQGFFGLVVVAAFVLAMLVGGEWLVARSERRDIGRFRAAGWALIGLVAVLVASCAQRLSLYMTYYGLTDARVYAAALTVAVALAVAWCGLTVMRGRRETFAAGLLSLAAVTVLTLHVMNPERLVVRVNATRAATGAEFDIDYHASLSADALPALRDAARALAREQCTALVAKVHEVWERRFKAESIDEPRRGRWSIPRARAAEWLRAPVEAVVPSICGAGAVPPPPAAVTP